MDLRDFVTGTYTVVLHADDYKRFFGICTYHGITFTHICNDSSDDDHTTDCSCKIRKDMFLQLQEIAKKTNVELEILQKNGMPVFIDKLKLHIWFFIGAVIALFLLVSLSNRIWNIQFDGNHYYDQETLLRFLSKSDISCGLSRDSIDCAGISSAIREAYPKVTWASAEIDGCNLIIHIKENPLIESEKEEDHDVAYDLVAEKDGIIYDMIVRNGIAQVEIGQSVKKGDILISGIIPIQNDAKEVIAYNTVNSDGDVYLQCEYAYYDEIQKKHDIQEIIEEDKIRMIQFGNYRFLFFWPFHSTKTKDSELFTNNMLIEQDIKITDTLDLPIKIGQIKQYSYRKTPQNYNETELKMMANERFQEFCTNLEKKGVQIYENNVKMEMSDVSCRMSGKVTVIEKSGTLQLSVMPQDYVSEMED